MTSDTELNLRHRLEPATMPGLSPLLLLHGTGGDENDLVPLGRTLSPGAALLSPRGRVLERGMPRFFRRLAEGVFDPEEVRQRADELADFVEDARRAYGLAAPIAVGFSNGANVASAMLIRRPHIISGAVLLRPMQALSDPAADLTGTPVLMLAGANDPMAPRDSVERLADQLRAGGASVDLRFAAAGHALVPADVSAAKTWLASIPTRAS